MGNTKQGAAIAVQTTRKRHGEAFIKQRASAGGKASKGGFKKGSEAARLAGQKGAAKRWGKK